MRRTHIAIFYLAVILVLATQCAYCQTATRSQALQIVMPNLPLPDAGEKYEVKLRAIGGTPPYRWSIQATPLPPGLNLNANTGVISGIPESSDEFSVLVQVTDSADPPGTHSKLLVASEGAPLTVRWTVRPHITAGNIIGAVRVENGSNDSVDVTVIVVAVNEIGKAFALRYEHLNLAPGKETPDLKFDSSLPPGQYTAHADAVGEVAAKKAIYRDRREQDGLVVQAQ
jgi:hypothetical protein